MEIREINGIKYIKTKRCNIDGKKYIELYNADVLKPSVIYVDVESNAVVEDFETFIKLREKYCIDKRVLNGIFILEWNFSSNQAIKETQTMLGLKSDEITCKDGGFYYKGKVYGVELDGKFQEMFECTDNPELPSQMGRYSDFFMKKGQEACDKVFENDVANFSSESTKYFGHILEKRGIEQPNKWFENKFRGDTGEKYIYAPELNAKDVAGQCDIKNGGIIYCASLEDVQIDKNETRAHEMGHKISSDSANERSGFLFYGEQNLVTVTGENRKTYTECGHALNEGATNLFANKITGKKICNDYISQTDIAMMTLKLVGEDCFFEAYLFDPKILSDKMKEISGDELAYSKLVISLDEYHKYNDLVLGQHLSTEQKIKMREMGVRQQENATAVIYDALNYQMENAKTEQEKTKAYRLVQDVCGYDFEKEGQVNRLGRSANSLAEHRINQVLTKSYKDVAPQVNVSQTRTEQNDSLVR